MEINRFWQYPINRGIVDEAHVYSALSRQLQGESTIGQIAIKERMLTVKQIMAILSLQAGTTKLFGEIAVEHGFVTDDDIRVLLKAQAESQPKLGEIRIEMGKIEADALGELLQAFHKLRAETKAAQQRSMGSGRPAGSHSCTPQSGPVSAALRTPLHAHACRS